MPLADCLMKINKAAWRYSASSRHGHLALKRADDVAGGNFGIPITSHCVHLEGD